MHKPPMPPLVHKQALVTADYLARILDITSGVKGLLQTVGKAGVLPFTAKIERTPEQNSAAMRRAVVRRTERNAKRLRTWVGLRVSVNVVDMTAMR